MSQKKPACEAHPFEQPVTLADLEAELEQALEDGLSIPAYEDRLAAQQVLWKDQSPKDQNLWNQGYRHRLGRHVLLASLAKSSSLIDHLWERVFAFRWSPKMPSPFSIWPL